MDEVNENLILPEKFPADYTAYQPNVLIGAFQGLKMETLKLYAEILNFNHKEEKDQLDYVIPIKQFLSTGNPDYVRKHKTEIVEKIVEPIGKYRIKLSSKDLKLLFPEHASNKDLISGVIHPLETQFFFKDHITLRLTPSFKRILIQTELGFTKGDIEFVRDINYAPSFWMYWLIRKHQQYENKWKKEKTLILDLDEIRIYLGLENKYNDWKDFKSYILDRAEKDFKGTWVEFAWKGININGNKGRGAKVTHVELVFLKDIQRERLFKLDLKFEWEDKLIIGYGFKQFQVEKIIRTKIRTNSQVGEFTDRFWDSDYVQFCIEIFEQKLKDIAQAKKEKKPFTVIKERAPYLYSVMQKGTWMEQVDIKRKNKADLSQLTIEGFDLNKMPFSKNPEKLIEPRRHETPMEIISEVYDAYLFGKPDNPLSLEQYVERAGYKIEGEVAVKYH